MPKALPPTIKMQDDLVAIKNLGQFDKLLKANTSDILKQGFADIRLVDDMGRTNDNLTMQIEAAYRKCKTAAALSPIPPFKRRASWRFDGANDLSIRAARHHQP